MAKRSRVELYEQIRKAHEREKLSIHELARRFHTHRRYVRRALESALPPPRKVPAAPGSGTRPLPGHHRRLAGGGSRRPTKAAPHRPAGLGAPGGGA